VLQPSNASATPVSTSPGGEPDLIGDWNLVPPSQPGHEGILGYLYGWQNLTRIDDVDGLLTDRWWSFTSGAEVDARAMFAGNTFTFGFLDSSSEFHGVLTYGSAQGYLNLGSRHFASSDPVNRFALFELARGRLFDSAQAQDHMVTFQVTGNANQYGRDFSSNPIGAFVIGWEDLPLSMSDRDYNDFVLAVRGVQLAQAPIAPIPEPPTVALFGSVLLLMWHVGRRQSRAND
jgi:hypothetical protein